jgi:hypothetical protein
VQKSLSRGSANVSSVVTGVEPGSRFFYRALPPSNSPSRKTRGGGNSVDADVGGGEVDGDEGWVAPRAVATVYVDSTKGSDNNAGTLTAPFRTIAKGVSSARGGGGNVILRGGTYYQGAPGIGTIHLTDADSGLSISAYPNEEVWISGGIQLNLSSWQPHNVNKTTGHNVWVASTAGVAGLVPFTGLRSGDARLTRARFPNNNQGESWMGTLIRPDGNNGNWTPPAFCPNARCANPPNRFEPTVAEGGPSRANESRSGTSYILGYGGDGCSLFSPPAGFNCVDNQRWSGQVHKLDRLA